MSITKEDVLNNLEEVKKYVLEAENKVEEKVKGLTIKTTWGSVIFESTKTTWKEAVEERLASDANLHGADLRGANLHDANLSGANLSDANLSNADLSNANLSGANLRDANLSGANLHDANLSGANLRDANLSNADLSNANLSGAELCRATFYGRGGTRELKRNQLPAFLGALGFVIIED